MKMRNNGKTRKAGYQTVYRQAPIWQKLFTEEKRKKKKGGLATNC